MQLSWPKGERRLVVYRIYSSLKWRKEAQEILHMLAIVWFLEEEEEKYSKL